MNLSSRLIVVFVVLTFVSLPGTVMARRTAISGVSRANVRTVDKTDKNAQLAYEALKSGKLEAARNYLEGANPENPYAMFVRAALTEDAVTAANMYREIASENEGTPIAREALIELYRYHYAAGKYAAAHRDYIELQKFPLPPPVPDPIGLRDSLENEPAFHSSEGEHAAMPATRPAPSEKAHNLQSTTYLVQVGVFTTVDNARRFIQDLRVYGVHGEMFRKVIGGKRYYGVSAGSFSDRNAADELAKKLKSRSVNCIVVEK